MSTHPIDHFLTLLGMFADDARRQYAKARVLNDQAKAPALIMPSAGALEGVAGRLGPVPSAQAVSLQQAQQMLDQANLSAQNAVMCAKDLGALLGVEVTIAPKAPEKK